MKGLKTPEGWLALSTLSEEKQKEYTVKAKLDEQLKDTNAFNYHGQDIDCFVNKEDLTKFILIRDDGGSFKVDAEFIVWYIYIKEDGTRHVYSQCLWSFKALKKTLKSIMLTGLRTADPDYQT